VSRRANPRHYPRTARLNQLLREILADTLEVVDDDRLDLVTVTAVEVEPDLRHAVVFYDSLQGEEGDEVVLEALGEARVRLQAAIGRQARTKRVPELSFRPDPGVRQGSRIDAILADIGPPADETDDDGDRDGGAGAPAEDA
jgi:ribosome-binding factor A